MLTQMFQFLADSILTLLLYLVLVRVLMQLCRVDRYNTLAQTLVRVTDPFLAPLRKVLPKSARWDLAGVLVLFVVALLRVVVQTGVSVAALAGPGVLLFALVSLTQVIIDFYLLLILVMVVLSFVAPGSYHPGAALVRQLTDPLLAPIQRFVPSLGGLDFSPMVLGMLLYMARDIVLPRLLMGL